MEKAFDENIYKIINGDSMKVLDTLEENSIDSVVTDPPYGLTSITKRFGKENSAPAQFGKDGSFARLSKGFMGKEWDGSGIEYNVNFWEKVYKVLKPGGYLLAFGGSRTFYRIACAIEDAGFEIRDTIMWLYGSGFPKSMNIGKALEAKEKLGNSGTADTNLVKEWQGWGTCLKPAYEPIIVARKPCEGTVADNIIKYGVGGINIDECRVGEEVISIHNAPAGSFAGGEPNRGSDTESYRDSIGRFPANVILTYDDTDFNEVCDGMPKTKGNGSEANYELSNNDNPSHLYTNIKSENHYGDEGSACRYFYCAKASKKDRDNGLDMLEEKQTTDGCIRSNSETARTFGANSALRRNIHPTVKPVELMQYLVRLVSPKGATILDPFNGSGSTGKAVAFENREREREYKYIGIELDKEYCEISKSRIDYALNKYEYDMIQDIKQEEEKTGQMSLFDFEGENE